MSPNGHSPERDGVAQPLLLRAFASMPEAVALMRADDGIIAYTNACWDRLFGYESAELAGRHFSITSAAPDEHVPGERMHAIVTALARDGVWRDDTPAVRKDGSRFMCTSSIAEFDDGRDGRIWVIVATRPRPEQR